MINTATQSTALAYYMPLYLSVLAQSSGNQQLEDFCQLFKIFNTNACVIDRTGTLTTPFRTATLYPIPQQTQNVKDFGTLCIERAEQILGENRPVMFMYSGGLDSTCMLIAFHEVLSRTRKWDQLQICTSIDAQSENPWAWHEIVLPNYKLRHARDMLGEISINENRYVQGENADQLFGSDRVFTEPHLLTQAFTPEALAQFLASRTDPRNQERLHHEFTQLAAKCPLPVKWMRDFLWWVNFTCKWQSVALRTLCFSNVFDNQAITLEQSTAFDTFYNTREFQELAISGQLDRWGTDPNPYSYKQAARDFILSKTRWTEYCTTKLKVGSLYHVIRQRTYVSNAIGFSDNTLFAVNLEDQLK